MNDIFKYAARHKLRFPSTRGELTVEQLWDVPLRMRDGSRDGFNLNEIAKSVSRAVKETEENFVETTRTVEQARREAAMEIVLDVISTKLAEEKAAATRAKNKQDQALLLAILAEKKAGKLSELSEKELERKIKALEEPEA